MQQQTMAAIASSSSAETAACEKPNGDAAAFDMASLRTHLPLKRKGLSMYYSGKSRSFTRLSDAKSVEDLKKVEVPEAKRRKYASRRCRIQSSGPSCNQSCVGV